MRIKTKVIVGTGLLMIIIMLLSGVGIKNVSELSSQVDEVKGSYLERVINAYHMRSGVNETAKIVANLILYDEAKGIFEEGKASVDEKLTEARQMLEVMEENRMSDTEKQLVQELKNQLQQFADYKDQIIELLENGEDVAASQYRQTEGLELQESLLASVDSWVDFNEQAMEEAINTIDEENQFTLNTMSVVTLAGLFIGLFIMLWNVASITKGLNTFTQMIRGFSDGTLERSTRLNLVSKDEFGQVIHAFNNMATDIEDKNRIVEENNLKNEEQTWLKTNVLKLFTVMQGAEDMTRASQKLIRLLTPVINAQYGGMYVRDKMKDEASFTLTGAYAKQGSPAYRQEIREGEGLVGQCAIDQEMMQLSNVPDAYLQVQSGTMEGAAHHILLYPIVVETETVGVMEFASINEFTPLQLELLQQTSFLIGVMLNRMFGRMQTEELLRESQALTEELQAQSEELMSQQDELKRSNLRLEEQTDALKRSEELLQQQQEELEQSNEELSRKTELLKKQVQRTERKNRQVEQARDAMEKQAEQLAIAAQYKTEFLTNMSHELRTPLNSLLILSQMLSENKDKNLTDKQVEYASTIHASGQDLLKLIDEILDLSKIDSGKMEVVAEHISLTELQQYMRRQFEPMALKKGLSFDVSLLPGLPKNIVSDGHRLKQILKNLLSNALKFTHTGAVNVQIQKISNDMLPYVEEEEDSMIAISVRDTGVGISKDKQEVIFEAFQQADGTISRQYGGTGLGLSISKELAELLGGTLYLESEEGQGSTFTLYVPEFYIPSVEEQPESVNQEEFKELLKGAQEAAAGQVSKKKRKAASALSTEQERKEPVKPLLTSEATPQPHQNELPEVTSMDVGVSEQMEPIQQTAMSDRRYMADDRQVIEVGDRKVLIIEDDEKFAGVLLDMARSKGFKGIVAMEGDTGLELVHEFQPDAILLDMKLPGMDGWSVLNHLKHQPETRHIPVHIVSVDDAERGLNMGALAFRKKPLTSEQMEELFTNMDAYLSRDVKRLLFLERDGDQRERWKDYIGFDDVSMTFVGGGMKLLEQLKEEMYDCVVINIQFDDMELFDLLDELQKQGWTRDLPFLIYTGKSLAAQDEERIRQYAESMIIRDVKTPERLLDETALFLHRVEANLPEEKRRLLDKLHSTEEILHGRRILIADDDIRNVYALTSVLEEFEMDLTSVENGQEALDKVREEAPFDLILMDIMMPEMDGYEAMRHIRSTAGYADVPIIALTAKAMKGDRNKCIEAGASDYISKPLQNDQLLSLMRVWLYP
ncbi:response regulator [Marinicrinis sediminis]|uniref:histidine kinase n=1 Tax=Marinicrinis sediminis TaxID=1652465 RepID=A0ABW5R8B4_9BACL